MKELKRVFTKTSAEGWAQHYRANLIEDQRSTQPDNRIGVGEANRRIHVRKSGKPFRRWSVFGQ
jgi:hypothetical protein